MTWRRRGSGRNYGCRWRSLHSCSRRRRWCWLIGSVSPSDRMTDFLLKLFNVRAGEAARISRADVNFHGVNPAWLLLLFVALAAAAVLLYRRTGEDLPRW